MHDDRLIRLALIVGVLVIFPIVLYHRLRAHATREPLDRRQEGWLVLATLRPAGLASWAGLIAYMISPRSMDWSSLPLPVWLRWSGIGLLVLDAPLLAWTLHTLGKNLTDTVVTRRDHSLVTTGPYRWIRHPFYACVALLILSASLASANWFVLGTGSLVLAFLGVRTRKEEENLTMRFGDGYRRYMERTGRFFPRLRAQGGR